MFLLYLNALTALCHTNSVLELVLEYRILLTSSTDLEDLIARRKDRLEQNLFMFDRDSSIVPILGNYDLPKTLQAR